ncbi:MAG: pilus assembly protein PilM [Candidatus Aquirickettsiella sp.]
MYFFKDRFKDIQSNNVTIGLDIGSNMIKWVSLGYNNELKQYAIQAISMPTEAPQNKDVTHIANILKKTLLDQEHIRSCIVNIPDILVCSKWVQIEHTDRQRIEETIELLVEQSIPYPLCNLYFDYQIFEPSPESQDKCKVLIVACRKEHVDFRLDIIQQANLIPIVVEMSSYALERAYCFFYPHKINEKTILLEIGASQLALLFFNNSQTMVYCENLFNLLEPESILLQIKRCIKKYILAYPSRILRELFLLVVDISLLNYLLNGLDGFSELKIKTLRYENQLKSISELNRNKLEQKFLDLFLSYGLALRKGK